MSIDETIRAVVREELRAALVDLRAALTPAAQPDVQAPMLTVEQVATHCGGVEPETVRSWIRRGELKACRPGGGRLYLVSPAELERFLAADTGARDSIDADQHMRLVQQRLKRAAGSR